MAVALTLFQSAPGRGATASENGAVTAWRFQSTPPDGETSPLRSRSPSSAPFQSTPPDERRRSSARPDDVRFQSTPRTGGDYVPVGGAPSRLFQSTSPDGGDGDPAAPDSDIKLGLITPPDGGRRRRLRGSDRPVRSPPDGGDVDPAAPVAPDHVSIHAPGRGATAEARNDAPRGGETVSIHAPGTGSDRSGVRRTHDPNQFRPRPRTGSDVSGLTAVPFRPW